jgi:hypothetical protein
MLDLCELDKRGLVSSNLRRLWIGTRGEDPLALARCSKRAPWEVADSFWMMILSIIAIAYSTDFKNLWGLWIFLFGLATGVLNLVGGIFWFVRGICSWRKAAKFSTLLEQAAGIWTLSPEKIAGLGMEQLRKVATGTLRQQAKRLRELELMVRPREEIEEQRRWFKDAHRTSHELGLVSERWDSYFKEEPKEEPPPAEVKES